MAKFDRALFVARGHDDKTRERFLRSAVQTARPRAASAVFASGNPITIKHTCAVPFLARCNARPWIYGSIMAGTITAKVS